MNMRGLFTILIALPAATLFAQHDGPAAAPAYRT